MFSVALTDTHGRVFDSFCRMFNTLDIPVYCPKAFSPDFLLKSRLAPIPPHDYAQQISYEEFIDIRPNIIISSGSICWKDCWEEAQKLQATPILSIGTDNDRVPPQVRNLISREINIYNKFDGNKIHLLMRPDQSIYKKQNWDCESKIASSFIQKYKQLWPTSWDIYNKIKCNSPELAFINSGEGDHVLTRQQDVVKMLSISRVMLHIKEQEGYGWSLLEAIACGIPIIAWRNFCTNKTCGKTFLQEGVTCHYIDEIKDFEKSFQDVDTLSQISAKGSEFLANLIDEQEQATNLLRFIKRATLKYL